MEFTHVANRKLQYQDTENCDRKPPYFHNPRINSNSHNTQNESEMESDEFVVINPSFGPTQRLMDRCELIRYESDEDIYPAYDIRNNDYYLNNDPEFYSHSVSNQTVSNMRSDGGINCISTNSNWKLSQFYYHASNNKCDNNFTNFNVEKELNNMVNVERPTNRNLGTSTTFNEDQASAPDARDFSYFMNSFPITDLNNFDFSQASNFDDLGYPNSSSMSSSSPSLVSSLESSLNSPELISPTLFEDYDILNLESIHSGSSFISPSSDILFHTQMKESQTRFEFPAIEIRCGSVDQQSINDHFKNGLSWNNICSPALNPNFAPIKSEKASIATTTGRCLNNYDPVKESTRTAELIRRNIEICQLLSPFRRYKELLQKRQKSKPVNSQQFVRRKFSLLSAINIANFTDGTKAPSQKNRRRKRQKLSDPRGDGISRPNVSVRRWQSEVWTKLHIQERNFCPSNNTGNSFVNSTMLLQREKSYTEHHPAHVPQLQQSHGYNFQRNNTDRNDCLGNNSKNNNDRFLGRSPPPVNVNLIPNNGGEIVMFR